MAPRYEELTEMSKADLITAYNDASPNVVVGLEWFRFELWVERPPGRHGP